MSISQMLIRTFNQTAVYWGKPEEDGSGGKTYANPVEIKCRWEDKQIIVNAADGKEVSSSSQVFTTEDLEEQGYLFLGVLDDLINEERSNPRSINKAYEIARVSKVPAIGSTTVFVKKAFLSWRAY